MNELCFEPTTPRDALDLIEGQVNQFYDLEPHLRTAVELLSAALETGSRVCLTCGELVLQGYCTCGPRQRLEVT